ncbi:MAG: hypothetical protein EA378_10580 [Phycisphaerales bacterium]|nr:MAG: hypothetical protein EA378_10580 [Phycisphaerales bacterium]
MPDVQKTTINRPWAIKSAIIGLAFLAFGLWGLYDALVAYPKRGVGYALKAEQLYLQAAHDMGRILRAGVETPDAELTELRRRAAAGEQLNAREAQLMEWLEALGTVGRLDPAFTDLPRDRGDDPVGAAVRADAEGADPEPVPVRIDGGVSRLQELNTYWATRTPPKKLRGYDIPSQWVILAIGGGVGLYVGFLFFKVGTTTYRWEPGAKALTLPGGATILPSDLDDVDKRKWEKFLVFLKIREGHETLGGQEIKLDLYRHAPLEDWVLEMERERFPERASEEASVEAEGETEELHRPTDGAPAASDTGSPVIPSDEDATRGA